MANPLEVLREVRSARAGLWKLFGLVSLDPVPPPFPGSFNHTLSPRLISSLGDPNLYSSFWDAKGVKVSVCYSFF